MGAPLGAIAPPRGRVYLPASRLARHPEPGVILSVNPNDLALCSVSGCRKGKSEILRFAQDDSDGEILRFAQDDSNGEILRVSG